jgi:hypothetical protein
LALRLFPSEKFVAPVIASTNHHRRIMPKTDQPTRSARVDIPATQNTSLGLSDASIVKITEYGGFVASVLVLCLFFWVLTQFVKQVKDD